MKMKLKSILITGASSGIGRAIALRLAKPGMVLYLSGRRQEALMQVAAVCLRQGATVYPEIIDVCDQQRMNQWIKSTERLDLVLACAGISTIPQTEDQKHVIPEPALQIRQIMQINVMGVLNTVLPALDVMQRQPLDSGHVRGRIAAIASVAGFFTSAWAPAYCASKAAVDRFMIASNAGWKSRGIVLSSICCGFVTTPMTDRNRFYMPGKISADKAAQLILQGIEAGKRRITFPVWLAFTARILDLLPASLLEKFYLSYLESGKR